MLFEAFKQAVGGLPSSRGLRLGGQTYSYHALAERSERLAAGLVGRLGLDRGDAVAILMQNSPELFVFAEALLAIGAIAVPLDMAANPTELERLTRPFQVRAIFARPDLLAVATQLAESLGVKLPVITSDSLSELEMAPSGPLPTVGADDVAVYLMSSGSTGRPKVVPRTHGELLVDATSSGAALGYAGDDLVLNLLPTHHAFGFAMTMSHAPLNGASTLLWPASQPLIAARGQLLETIEAEGVTMLPGVPFLFDLLAAATNEVDLSKVRLAFSSAIALKRSSFDNFRERFGIALRQAFGTTETMLVSFNDHADVDATWDSVGRTVGGARVDVVPVPENSEPGVGELIIGSPAVTKGYLDNPEANAASFKDGAWISGDLGRVDAEGNVYIIGRKKLIVEVAGHKVDPVEIEDILMSHPAVAEAVVIGIPDRRSGEQRLKAVVVKRSEETAGALVDFARRRLSAHKVPYIVEFRDSLPRSATGKILRGKLVD